MTIRTIARIQARIRHRTAMEALLRILRMTQARIRHRTATIIFNVL